MPRRPQTSCEIKIVVTRNMRCSVGLVVLALTIAGVTCETSQMRSVPRRSKADGFSASEFASRYLARGAPVLVTDAAAGWPIMQWTNASGVATVAEKLSCGTSTRVWSEASEGKLADASEDGGSGDVVSVSSSCAGDTSWSDLGLRGRPYFLDQTEERGAQSGEGVVVERRGAATDAVESWEDAQCACSFSIQVCGHARAVCMCLWGYGGVAGPLLSVACRRVPWTYHRLSFRPCLSSWNAALLGGPHTAARAHEIDERATSPRPKKTRQIHAVSRISAVVVYNLNVPVPHEARRAHSLVVLVACTYSL